MPEGEVLVNWILHEQSASVAAINIYKVVDGRVDNAILQSYWLLQHCSMMLQCKVGLISSSSLF